MKCTTSPKLTVKLYMYWSTRSISTYEVLHTQCEKHTCPSILNTKATCTQQESKYAFDFHHEDLLTIAKHASLNTLHFLRALEHITNLFRSTKLSNTLQHPILYNTKHVTKQEEQTLRTTLQCSRTGGDAAELAAQALPYSRTYDNTLPVS